MGCECKPDIILNGFYQCLWRERGESGRTSRLEKVVFSFVFFVLVFTAMWLYFFSVIYNDFSGFNEFIFESVGFYFHWYLLILLFSIVATLYVLMVFVSGLYLSLVNYTLRLSLCNKIFIPIILIIGIVGFISIKLLSSDQYFVVSVSFEIIGPFLQVCAIVVYACSSWYFAYILLEANRFVKIIALITYTVFLIFLLTIPLWIFSSCIGPGIKNNPKPLLLGHRGAPKYAPENTMLSFQDALSCGVFAFESDIRISMDGIPFLMHDSTLLRTTDVGQIFPERKNNRPETFTWNELQQLNAGSWFLQDNPFLTNHDLSAEKRSQISIQKIPTLLEFAQLASMYNQSIMFDLRFPPSNHSTADTFVNITVQTILNSGINQSLVFWLFGFSDQVNLTEMAPGFKIVSSHPSSSSTADMFNLFFPDVTTEVLSYNIPTISYVINDNWPFTRAWCQNVWAVTTDNSCELNQVSKPGWVLMRNEYIALYIMIDLLSIFILLGAILWHIRSKRASTTYLQNDANQVNGITIIGFGYQLEPVT